MPHGDRIQNLTALLRAELPRLREQYAVESLGLFGSYVRGEHEHDSDLDILVEFFRAPTFFQFLDL